MNPFRRAAQARAEKRRHEDLLRIAEHLVRREVDPWSPKYEATAADLIALAFGRHQLDIDETEADRYLNAARAEKGVTR